MNLVFRLIKAGYQTNQTVVAATIWLSFTDFFFSIWAEAMLSFPQLSCLKHRGQQKMRKLLFMSCFYSDFTLECGADEDQEQGRLRLAAGRGEYTSWVFTWKVWRSNFDSCWPGQGRLWACITWLTGRSSSCAQTAPRTNQHVPGELILLQMLVSSRYFPHPSPLFSAHVIVRGMKVCCRTFFSTADLRQLIQSDQQLILNSYWKYNVFGCPDQHIFSSVDNGQKQPEHLQRHWKDFLGVTETFIFLDIFVPSQLRIGCSIQCSLSEMHIKLCLSSSNRIYRGCRCCYFLLDSNPSKPERPKTCCSQLCFPLSF